MRKTVVILMAVFILGCNHTKNDNVVENKEISLNKDDEKIKSITSISHLTKIFSPDSLVFEEKIIQYFDTVGQLIEMKQYVVDSTILFTHQFQEYKGDTLFKIEKNIRNVFKPNLKIDTVKFVKNLMVESIRTFNFRYTHEYEKGTIETPIPTRILYNYDEKERLKTTTQYFDGTIYQCNYSYNENNQLLEKLCSSNDSPDRYYKEKLFYNDKGLVIKKTETTFEDDSIIGEYQRFYKYNQYDSLSYQSWYHDGRNFLIYNYMFNEKGQKIAEYIYNDSSGDSTRLMGQTLYHYNENDNLTMVSRLAINKDPIYTIYYFYNDNNNVIEEREILHTIGIDRQSYETRKITRYYYEYY